MSSSTLFKALSFVFVVFSIGSCTPQPEVVPDPPAGKCLSISDIHLGQFYDTSLVRQLVQAPYPDWAKVFALNQTSNYGPEGEDTHYELFASLIDGIRINSSTPNLIILSGDFLAHHFVKDCFQKVAMTNPQKDAFVRNTIRFVLDQIKALYPKAMILPVLGNNDSYCGDYKVTPNGDFLKDLVPIWLQALGATVDKKTFTKSFTEGGYYSIQSPLNPKHRLIGLNTVLFSSSYMGSWHKNYCPSGNLPQDSINKYANQQLSWLKKELQAAQAQQEKVWLAYHIPPGYNVAGALGGSSDPVFWDSLFSVPFINLVNDFSNTISAQFAGHTHMDHFMIINDVQQQPSSFIHITPSVSPIFNNNPSFFEYTFDIQKAQLQNYRAWYFRGIEHPQLKTWKKEYDFQKVYRETEITAQSLNDLRESLNKGGEARDSFLQYYGSSEDTLFGIYLPNAANWSYFSCALTIDSGLFESAYKHCVTVPARE